MTSKNLKMRPGIFFFFIFCICTGGIKSQNPGIDSLKRALLKAKHDTDICRLYYNLGAKFFNLRADSARPYFERSIAIAEKHLASAPKGSAERNSYLKNGGDAYQAISEVSDSKGRLTKLAYCEKGYALKKERNDVKGMARLLNNIGNAYYDLGDSANAQRNFNQSLELRRSINDVEGIGQSLGNLGNLNYMTGNIPRALEYYSRAIKVLQNSDFKKELAHALLSISFIYSRNGDVKKALEYIEQSLEINKKIDNKSGMAAALTEMGNMYFAMNDFKKAMSCFEQSLKLYGQTGNIQATGDVYNGIAGIYFMSGDVKKAAEELKKAMDIYEKSGNKYMLSTGYNNLGEIYLKQGNAAEAIKMLLKSKRISDETGSPVEIRAVAKALYEAYKVSGNYKLALQNCELYLKMKDSVENESSRKAMLKTQIKFEFEKKAAADSVAHAKENEVKNAELAKQNAEIRARKNQQYALIGGLALVLIFAIIMFNRFKVTNRQKSIIAEQKIIVEEKQKEILDSINYASRIQRAQLPGDRYIVRNLDRLKKPDQS
jgi:tetratricopeptide (TPR) repeat protein